MSESQSLCVGPGIPHCPQGAPPPNQAAAPSIHKQLAITSRSKWCFLIESRRACALPVVFSNSHADWGLWPAETLSSWSSAWWTSMHCTSTHTINTLVHWQSDRGRQVSAQIDRVNDRETRDLTQKLSVIPCVWHQQERRKCDSDHTHWAIQGSLTWQLDYYRLFFLYFCGYRQTS